MSELLPYIDIHGSFEHLDKDQLIALATGLRSRLMLATNFDQREIDRRRKCNVCSIHYDPDIVKMTVFGPELECCSVCVETDFLSD